VSESVSVKLHTHTPATSIFPNPSFAEASSVRKWIVSTPRGSIHTSHILHASNAYASYLLPHIAADIKPVRGQVLTTREQGARNGKQRMEGWGGNEGFEYWFPRPRKNNGEEPLIVLGGGREASGGKFEIGIADDSIVNNNTGEALRAFLPAVFAASKDKAHWNVEQEWVSDK
jgi:glycine/D-amino acid oxidase-like deaminating enzyme